MNLRPLFLITRDCVVSSFTCFPHPDEVKSIIRSTSLSGVRSHTRKCSHQASRNHHHQSASASWSLVPLLRARWATRLRERHGRASLGFQKHGQKSLSRDTLGQEKCIGVSEARQESIDICIVRESLTFVSCENLSTVWGGVVLSGGIKVRQLLE